MMPFMRYVVMFFIALILNTNMIRSSLSQKFASQNGGDLSFTGEIILSLILVAAFAAYDAILADKIDIAGVKL
jgi:hypothetical protein